MHLGVIPDGNRRYADEQGISNREAYKKAKEVIKQIGEDLRDDKNVDVEEVTFYLLSEENLNRSEEELETLFELLEQYIENISTLYHRNGFQLNWATTNPGALPEYLQEKLRDLEEKLDSGDKQLNLLISYDGKKDILQASESISDDGANFDDEAMKKNLQIETDIDYVIRTGDNAPRECLSGFPIWNSSYAEFYHIKKNFPAVKTVDVKDALAHFDSLRRKKGR